MSNFNMVEEFVSINGETTFSGERTYFVRLSKCQLACKQCDTPQRNDVNYTISHDNLKLNIDNSKCNIICITGGEPLLHDNLIDLLAMYKYNVEKTFLIETNGATDISLLKSLTRTFCCNIVFVMDIKSPSTGMNDRMMLSNLNWLSWNDQLKFVLNSNDIIWFKEFYNAYKHIPAKWLVSPMWDDVDLKELADIVVQDVDNKLKLQIQLHKVIWGPKQQGV